MFVQFGSGVNWARFCLICIVVIAVHCQFLFHGGKFTPVNRDFELVKILWSFSTWRINQVALKMTKKLFSIFFVYNFVTNISSLPYHYWNFEWLARFSHLFRNFFCARRPWAKSWGTVVWCLMYTCHNIFPRQFCWKYRNIGLVLMSLRAQTIWCNDEN